MRRFKITCPCGRKTFLEIPEPSMRGVANDEGSEPARRNLTQQQRRELIREELKQNPARSNRQIAKALKVDDKTVAVQRLELEWRAEIPNVSTVTDTLGRQQPVKKQSRNGDPPLQSL
jgi:hypothetical protein